MTVENLNEVLNVVEGAPENPNQSEAFEIYVKNANSGHKMSFYTKGENWLQQVYEATAVELGFSKEKSNPIYVNEDGKSTTEGEMTIAEFGVKAGSVLTINPDGRVAAK